jgi:purine-cytosine permease-like protein
MVVSAFAIGALAYPVFFLGFVDTILTIFFINILGILPVCFFSTFGPKFGLRQMVLSRFFFGWYGVKVSKCAQHLFMCAILSKSQLGKESVCYKQSCYGDL